MTTPAKANQQSALNPSTGRTHASVKAVTEWLGLGFCLAVVVGIVVAYGNAASGVGIAYWYGWAIGMAGGLCGLRALAVFLKGGRLMWGFIAAAVLLLAIGTFLMSPN